MEKRLQSSIFNTMLLRLGHTTLFAIGLFIALFIFAVGILPAPSTYLLMWQFEVTVAIFLGVCCVYLLVFPPERVELTRREVRFVVLPMAAMIAWSVMSSAWAASWRSAMHHALVWALYLIFYLIVRQIVRSERGLLDIGTALVTYLMLFSIVAVSGYVSLLIFTGPNPLGKLAKHGEQVVTLLPLLLVYVVGVKGRRFWIGTTAITLLWLLIYCTLGRINLFLFGVCFVATAMVILVTKSKFNAESVEDAELGQDAPLVYSEFSYAPSSASAFKNLAIITAAIILAPILLQTFSLLSEAPDAAPLAVQRFSDEEALSSSNDFRRLMNSVSKEVIASHPLLGIGADNFGFEVNDYRKIYASKHPDDVSLRQAEDNIPERAHNEFLQIAAELGVVGVAITAWLAIGMLWLAFRSVQYLFIRRSGSPLSRTQALLLTAAVIGLGAFCISSLVSSYSFRLIQNGLVFFYVLAIAWQKETEAATAQRPNDKTALVGSAARALPLVGAAACVLMLVYWTPRLASVYYVNKANHTQDLAEAERLYSEAEALDDENPDASYYHGIRLYSVDHSYADAAPHMAKAIRLGRARSVDFFHLASTKLLAGDPVAAERTMAEALELYPQSAFVLTRYAHLLRMNGKEAESEAMLARARARNARDANAWWTLFTEGLDPAADKAFRDPANYSPLMELRPLSALYAVRDEIFILHPDQKNKLDMLK